MIRAAHTRVELVCVDELHNLNLATRWGGGVRPAEVLHRSLPATFVYAGIDLEVQGLFAGVRGRQIAGRFTVVPAAPFAYGTGAQRQQWRALIAALESVLRLHRHRTGNLVRLGPFTPGRGGEALLVVNKDRTAECERTARLVTASLSSALSGCLPSTTGFLNGSSGHLRTGSETTTRQRHRMTLPPSPRLIHHRRRSTTPPNAWDGGSSAQPTHYERGVNFEIGETER